METCPTRHVFAPVLRNADHLVAERSKQDVLAARRAAAFGLEIVAYDPYRTRWEDVPLQPVATLSEAVADARLHLASRVPLQLYPPPYQQRNDTTDVANPRAHSEGKLSSVTLDVMEVEPLPDEYPLRRHPRALVTPHMSFYSVEAQAELQLRTVGEVVRALKDEPPISPVILP